MATLESNLLISWDGSTWTDESAYLVSASGTFSFVGPADFLTSGGGITNQASILLASPNDRYVTRLDPLSFFDKHVRLSVDTGAGVQRIFSGVINSVNYSAPNSAGVAQLTLQCSTMESSYLQRKYDLSIGDFRYLHSISATEVDWFNMLLDRVASPLTRDFDPGVISIPWLWMDDESILEECWKAAASAGGVFYTNVLGHVVYRNASSIAKQIGSPVETLSRTAGSYSTASLSLNQDNLYSDVIVEISTRSISDVEQVWTPEDYANLIVPPAGSLIVNATFNDPVYSMDSVEWEARGANGGSLTSYVSMSRVDYAQKCQLTFTNTHPSLHAIIPYIRVNAYPVVGRVAFERTASSTDSYWSGRNRRTRSMRQNVYVQTPVQGAYLADLILAQSESPRAEVRLVGIPGKTSRFIGNVVRVQDDRMRSADIVGQIQSMSWQLSQKFEQSIVVQDFSGIYPYTPYFVLNTDVLCGPRKIFY